jgi:Zn-dependent protease with chaperone function
VRPAPRQSQQLYQLPPDKLKDAIELNRQLDALHFAGVAWTLIVLALMIRFRAGARLARWGAVSAFAVLAVPWIAALPFSAYRHHLGLRYQLSIEPWGPWLWDWFKGGFLTTTLAAALAAGLVALVRHSPRRWWLYAWAASIGVMVAGTYAAPLLFDPLFYDFRPLSRTRLDLIAPLQDVARKAGHPVPAQRIFEMNASEKTTTLNAYMTGVGSSKRIIIWDTATKRLTAPQIQTIFAHELGHYALGHIPRSIAAGAAGLLILFWLARRMRIHYETLPRALFIVTLAGFLAEPVVNTYSRWQEHEADAYELAIMRGILPEAGANSAEVTRIMAEMALDDPNPHPFIEFWLYDHPSTEDRMRFALGR